MTKFENVFNDTQELFNKVISKTDLERVISIKILANDNLKDIGKVSKTTDVVKFLTNQDVIILLNEKIFNQLNEEQRLMIGEELIANIGYDFEKDKLVISKPDINAYSLLLKKVGVDKYLDMKETIKLLFKAEEDKKDQTKNQLLKS